MPTVRAHRQHHTAPAGLCGVNCTACVSPLRGFRPTAVNRECCLQICCNLPTINHLQHFRKNSHFLCNDFESEEEFPVKSVAITDMQGQLLAILPVNDVRCTLNVHKLAPGTYIAHVETKAGMVDRKFVVGR